MSQFLRCVAYSVVVVSIGLFCQGLSSDSVLHATVKTCPLYTPTYGCTQDSECVGGTPWCSSNGNGNNCLCGSIGGCVCG